MPSLQKGTSAVAPVARRPNTIGGPGAPAPGAPPSSLSPMVGMLGGGTTAAAPPRMSTPFGALPATATAGGAGAGTSANVPTTMHPTLTGGPGQGPSPYASTLQPLGPAGSAGPGGGTPNGTPNAPVNPATRPPLAPGPSPYPSTVTPMPGTPPLEATGTPPLPPGVPVVPNEPWQGTTGPGTDTAGPPAPPVSWLEMLQQQFGAGNPFGDLPAGPDPVAAARAQADAWADTRSAALNERFAGSGIAPTSGRSGIEQGRIAGAAEAGLGTNLAQLGVAQRGSDLDRLMGGFLDAGKLSLGQQQLPIQVLQALMGGGQTLLGLQESERMPPLLQALIPFLTNFGPTRQTGFSATRS